MNQGRCTSNCVSPDGIYAVSWIRTYGKGRVFYSSLGHSPRVFWDARILQHFLAGIQFALGDLTAASAQQQPTKRPRSVAEMEPLLARIATYEHGQSREALASPALIRQIEARLAVSRIQSALKLK